MNEMKGRICDNGVVRDMSEHEEQFFQKAQGMESASAVIAADDRIEKVEKSVDELVDALSSVNSLANVRDAAKRIMSN